jgi:hypothetical protein
MFANVYVPPVAVVVEPIVVVPCVNVTATPACPVPLTRTVPVTLPGRGVHVTFDVTV